MSVDWLAGCLLRDCGCTKEYVQKGRKSHMKDEGSCLGVVLIIGKSLHLEKGCSVFLLLEEVITALNVCRLETRNSARDLSLRDVNSTECKIC